MTQILAVCATHIYPDMATIFLTARKTMKNCLFQFYYIFTKCLLLQSFLLPFQYETEFIAFFFSLVCFRKILCVCVCELLGCIFPGRFHLIKGRPSMCRYLHLHVIPGSLDSHFRKITSPFLCKDGP